MSDFEDRLGEWMRGHPVRQPHSVDPGAFTAAVMGRVRREPRPGAVRQSWPTWVAWPRLALAAVAAMACLAFVVVSEAPVTVARLEPAVVATGAPGTKPADGEGARTGAERARVGAERDRTGAERDRTGAERDRTGAEPAWQDQIRALEFQAYVLASLDELDPEVVPLSEADLVDELVDLDELAPSPDDEDDAEALSRELRVLDELGES